MQTKTLYEAVPFDPSPQRAKVVSDLLRGFTAHDPWWSDAYPRCADNCALNADATDFCGACSRRFAAASLTLSASDTKAWEVWEVGEGLVGVVLLTKIRPGEDALVYYIFFDRRLKGKEDVLKDLISWSFHDHEGWRGLQRMTIEVGRHAAPLALHAQRKLGFGGPFKTEVKGRTLDVEGVKRDAFRLGGEAKDLLVLGLLKPPEDGEA